MNVEKIIPHPSTMRVSKDQLRVPDITADEVREITERHATVYVSSHECSICDADAGWIILNDGVVFDGGCRCKAGYDLAPRPSSFQEIADLHNLQPTDYWRRDLRARLASSTTHDERDIFNAVNS